jgi:hypothetical protein
MPLPQNEKGGVRGKLANAATSIDSIAIRKRKQENSKKKVGAIPKMGISFVWSAGHPIDFKKVRR